MGEPGDGRAQEWGGVVIRPAIGARMGSLFLSRPRAGSAQWHLCTLSRAQHLVVHALTCATPRTTRSRSVCEAARPHAPLWDFALGFRFGLCEMGPSKARGGHNNRRRRSASPSLSAPLEHLPTAAPSYSYSLPSTTP
eukprot:scaffold20566_cov135-Isochrysis_galbana.AAC.11